MDLIVKDESPSQISDRIKDLLYVKSAEHVANLKPSVANSLFADAEVEVETEVEQPSAETEVVDSEPEETTEEE